MPNAEVLAGRNLLTERPIPDKRYHNWSATSGDLALRPIFVALTYDTRHLTEVTWTDSDQTSATYSCPFLYLADDANQKILAVKSLPNAELDNQLEVVKTYSYPMVYDSLLTEDSGDSYNAVKQCYGLATLNEPDDCLIAFLSEPQVIDPLYVDPADTTLPIEPTARYPILYYLRLNPSSDSGSEPTIEKWAVVDAGRASKLDCATDQTFTQCLQWSVGYTPSSGTPVPSKKHIDFGRGISEYHNDLLVVGKWRGKPTILAMDYYGQPLAQHPTFNANDALCGVQYINGRTYTTMDRSDDINICGRILAKFLTEPLDTARMVPLMSIEPFFLGPSRKDISTDEFYYYGPDMTLYQDRMAACYLNNVYTYKMAYFSFITNGLPNDDIDLGSVLIGDYKIQKVIFKNIADVYKMRDVTLTVDTTKINAGTHPKLAAATHWVFLATADPAGDTTDLVTLAAASEGGGTSSQGIWSQQINFATSAPFIEPDGERIFYVGVGVPDTYSASGPVGSTALVGVDDGPFCVPLVVTAKLG